VGHEIVGKVVRVGSQAEGGLKVGDRVGVGGQSDSCRGRLPRGECDDCSAGLEQYCPNLIATYNSRQLNGGKSMGGHATYHRCPSHFVFKIPNGVASEHAAPMLCGGLTLYSPLKKFGCGPGKRVGIVGVGGLGHFGVVFAKAMGAEVVGISRKAAKRDEVLQMGADEYIATDDDRGWAEKHRGTFDLLVSTVSSANAPFEDYVWLLRRDGVLVQVGNPDDGGYTLPHFPLLARRIGITGSSIGSPAEMREMLDMAARTGAKFWVETRPMKEANQAIVDMEEGKARYRYVLVN
jgi:D-arabinose 1-dehydrogenase-like Zn-dependent alcohol dehydrogenase